MLMSLGAPGGIIICQAKCPIAHLVHRKDGFFGKGPAKLTKRVKIATTVGRKLYLGGGA